MADRSELEYFVPASHEEDEAENEPGEEQGPCACGRMRVHEGSVTVRLDEQDVPALSNDTEFSGERKRVRCNELLGRFRSWSRRRGSRQRWVGAGMLGNEHPGLLDVQDEAVVREELQ